MTTVEAPHRLRRLTGRDPHEDHRAASPLELLFDLTFVVAFSAAGNELAHALAEGHVRSGAVAFAFVNFAICWAWINYSWFASAFDTDDWAFRLLTMVQMGGVIVLALGIPPVFSSIDHGETLGNGVLVAGYVVMRTSMVGLWWRVRRDDLSRRRCANTYITTIVFSQVLWCLLLVPDLPVGTTLALATIPLAIELAGPVLAERRHGGTPWHPHHVAERYGLLVIITLGEAVIGTVAAMSAHVNDPEQGWTAEAVVVLAAGVGLTFGMWWVYFGLPWGELLHRHRERSFFWGYAHILVFGAIAATGAGLHVVQYLLDDHSALDVTGTLLTVLIPVTTYLLTLYVMYSVSMRAADPFHVLILVVTVVVLAAEVVLAEAGGSIAACLVVVALAPVVTIVAYETIGHRHMQEHLEVDR